MNFRQSLLRKLLIFPLMGFIPVLMFISGIKLFEARGPNYLQNNIDPAYLYLINSLKVSTLQPTTHVDNPGLTVQLTGGLILRVLHPGLSQHEMERLVLSNPEYYLGMIHNGLLIVAAIILFVTGLVIWNVSGNTFLALLFQTSPFLSEVSIHALSKVSPELYLMVFSLALATGIFVYMINNKPPTRTTIFVLAVIGALGIATKINFLPLLIAPVFLFSHRQQWIKYGILLFMITAILFIPAYSHLSYLLNWLWNVLTHIGHYGEGASGFLAWSDFSMHLLDIIRNNYFFIAIVFLTTIILLQKIVSKKISFKQSIQLRALAGLWVAVLISLIMVGKHYTPHYLLPALMMTFPLLYGVFMVILFKDNMGGKKAKLMLQAVSLLLVLGMGIQLVHSKAVTNQIIGLKSNRDRSLSIYEQVQGLIPAHTMIYTPRSSSPAVALYAGANYNFESPDLLQLLDSIYHKRSIYFFGFYGNDIRNWSEKTSFQQLFENHEKVMYFGVADYLNEMPVRVEDTLWQIQNELVCLIKYQEQ